MAETQHDHRLAIESSVISSNISGSEIGSHPKGFIIAMTAILGGIFLVYVGKEIFGLASIVTALAGLAGVFVYGKYEQKKDLANKARSITTTR